MDCGPSTRQHRAPRCPQDNGRGGIRRRPAGIAGVGARESRHHQPALAETLARYAANLKYEDIPDDVVRITKRTILDTIGCAFGGYSAGPSRIAIKLAGDVSAKQPATVLISGTKTSADLATFANGTMIRYLDFNDAFVSLTHGAGHPSDTIAALLAAAEVKGAQRPRSHHRDRAGL